MSFLPGPAQAGWFPDPTGRFDTRYWDGSSWTKAVMRGETVETDSEFTVEPAKVQFPSITVEPPAAPAQPFGTGDRFTSLPLAEAQSRVGQMLGAVGAVVTFSTPGRIDAAVSTKGEPNVILTIVLACLCVIPAIIYWAMASRPVTRPATFTFVSVDSGTRVGMQADPATRNQLAPVLAQLPW